MVILINLMKFRTGLFRNPILRYSLKEMRNIKIFRFIFGSQTRAMLFSSYSKTKPTGKIKICLIDQSFIIKWFLFHMACYYIN